MKVLITGSTGQVGQALLAACPSHAQLQALAHSELDICDAPAVRRALEALRPAVIINAAAYTAVDQAESEPERAQAVNADGPRNLAQAASAAGIRLLHLSTDYVFDGRAAAPYRPGDAPHPLNVYGRTKLQGERAVCEILPQQSAVLRTAWVYAAQGRNFLLSMLRLMRERGRVRVVCDQKGSPTAASSVAAALWRLVERPQLHGVLHWTDAGVVSWYQFACAIAEEALSRKALANAPQVLPITSAEYPTAAARPGCSALDTSDSALQLGIEPVPWRTSLGSVFAQLAAR